VLHGAERDINVAFNLIVSESFIEAAMQSTPLRFRGAIQCILHFTQFSFFASLRLNCLSFWRQWF